MRKPILTNKVLRGLQCLSRFANDTHQPFDASEREDAQRAREWIAAMAEWWRETHEGRKP